MVPSDTVRELDQATHSVLRGLADHGLDALAGNSLKIVVATTDVHEHSKMLLERVFDQMDIEVIDGGVSVDPEDLAKITEESDASAVALSTYNGVALTYFGQLQDELAERGIDLPVMIGGQLNEIPQDSQDALPRDVGEDLAAMGAVVCRRVSDAMPCLLELNKLSRE